LSKGGSRRFRAKLPKWRRKKGGTPKRKKHGVKGEGVKGTRKGCMYINKEKVQGIHWEGGGQP